MAHIGQKRCLCPAGILRDSQGLGQGLVLRHAFAHFRVDLGEAEADRMDDMVIPVLRPADAGHTDHLVILAAFPLRQIAIGDDGLGGETADGCGHCPG